MWTACPRLLRGFVMQFLKWPYPKTGQYRHGDVYFELGVIMKALISVTILMSVFMVLSLWQDFIRFIWWMQTQSLAVANPLIKPSDMGCECGHKLLPSTPTIIIYCYYLAWLRHCSKVFSPCLRLLWKHPRRGSILVSQTLQSDMLSPLSWDLQPHMGSRAVMCHDSSDDLVLYKSFTCYFRTYLFASLLIYCLKNRPIPFPGQRSKEATKQALVFCVYFVLWHIYLRIRVCFCRVCFSFSVLSQEIGWEERLRNDLCCIWLDVKP